MASRHTVDSKRFIYRSPGKKIIAYVKTENKSRPHVTSKTPSFTNDVTKNN